MRRLKIVYVIDCGLSYGGAPQSTCVLAEEMSQNHEVYMLMPKTEDKGYQNITFIQLSKFKDIFPFIFRSPLKAFLLVKEIYKEIKRINPDIIHAQTPRGARALGLLKMMGLIKVPLIYTEREYVTGLRKIYQLLYSILVARPYDMIICLSKKSVPFWLKYRKDGVVTIPNPGGREYDIYSEKDRDKAIAHVEQFDSENINVLFVGRHITTKRWDLVEKIIYSYNKSFPKGKVHFYIAVAFGNNDIKAKEMIERMLTQKNVTVYPNADVSMMSNLYYSCDLHLITSSIESFGRTAIEAMSRKCAVYSTDAGAISETIGDMNYILPPDVDKFVNVISKYEKDKVQLESVKLKMFQRYHSLYTTEANYQANMKVYLNLLNYII